MPQKLALLICANPRTIGKGASVYVPFGAWEIDNSEVVDSIISLECQSLTAEDDENWERVPIRENKIEEDYSAKCVRVSFDKIGTEKSITLTIQKCH